MKRDNLKISRRTFLGGVFAAAALALVKKNDAAEAGRRVWKRGDLQIHFIYTGVGEQMFYIFPDGTTMLLDCGNSDTSKHRMPAPIPPAVKGRAGEYVADYILRVNPAPDPSRVDYMMTSHYHADHTHGYQELIERIHFSKAFDRTWPDVNFPCRIEDYDQKDQSLPMMRGVYEKLAARDGLVVEKWRVGEREQLKLLHGGADGFSVFNLCANGFAADETTGKVVDLYHDYPDKQPGFKGNQYGKQWINENGMSIGFILTYGAFRFFCAGDFSDAPCGRSIEEALAGMVRPVTAAKMSHHGFNQSMPPALVAALRPREWFNAVWNHAQNSAEVIARVTDRGLYPGERRIHSCFFTPSRPCADVADPALYEGRTVVLTVAPGGKDYRIDYVNP